MHSITPRMQQLQSDFSAMTVHRFCHHFMGFGMLSFAKFSAEWVQTAAQVRRKATRHNQAYATFGSFFIKGRQLVQPFLIFF
ncbi:Uncharacterised protein [Vibrio cholerae]|uniref:Uncharacterized protein n=1 Tax=Vibrio cholerae TaxID=666 RepID=A0A655V456_VIBCL|nr:Uncharacterised protein [Vibrio cholerae]